MDTTAPTPNLDAAAYQAGYAIGTGLVIFFALCLVAGIVFATICGYMASKRGRSVGLGIAAGFFFGLPAVVYYLLAGDATEVRVRKEEAVRASLTPSKPAV